MDIRTDRYEYTDYKDAYINVQNQSTVNVNIKVTIKMNTNKNINRNS